LQMPKVTLNCLGWLWLCWKPPYTVSIFLHQCVADV